MVEDMERFEGVVECKKKRRPALDDAEEEAMGLLTDFVDFAGQMLEKYGSFHPFGAAMMQDRSKSMVSVAMESEHPDANDVIGEFVSVFRSGAASGEYDATALFFDSRVKTSEGTESDAISVRLDHRDAISTVVHLPYTISRRGLLRRRKVDIGSPLSEPGEFQIFGKMPG